MAKTILVIDDDPDILEILRVLLQEEGYDVQTSLVAVSLDQIAAIGPALMMLDVRLVGSEQNGDELCREVKSDDRLKPVPVILISAEFDLKSLASACGAEAFLAKPFDIGPLFDTIIRCIP